MLQPAASARTRLALRLLVSRSLLFPASQDPLPESLPDGNIVSYQTEDGLTLREQEILAALASGARNRDLAQQLDISQHTVKFHLKNVYAKLDVSNRAQAVTVFLSSLGPRR